MADYKDCKTCVYSETLYLRERSARFSDSYSPAGMVQCKGPRYKGRRYYCRDNRKACIDYKKKER